MNYLTKLALSIGILFIFVFVRSSNAGKRNFAIDYNKNVFVKDGEPFRYVSGSMHYFKVPTQLWRDRLQKMKYGGLNVIQTYIKWSSVERTPGVYDFSGNNNITRFINEAMEEGLLVIIRVGPFIDAEVDMGGLPPWLLASSPDIKLRTSDPKYLQPLDRWLNVLLPMLKPLMYNNGGPIIMVQPENEFGSYMTCSTSGDYKAYMRDTFLKLLGNDTVLFTTDGNLDSMLKCGKIPNVFSTVDFGAGGNASNSFGALRRTQPNGPLVNSEYYSGWLDHWGHPHSMVSSKEVGKTLDNMLSMNASVNIYMYHGGTNFGFDAGSNLDNGIYDPCPTSYDYDAPISEAAYESNRNKKTFSNETEKMHLPPTKMQYVASIFDLLPMPILNPTPLSFEQLNHSYGFMLYSTNLTFQPTDPIILSIPGQTHKITQVAVLAQKNSRIDILVENQGRYAYGPDINQRKGILSNVTLNDFPLTNGWKHYRIFEDWTWSNVLEKIDSMPRLNSVGSLHIPSFYVGSFVLPENGTNFPLDSFLRVNGWWKGVAFLNGHNLGRYWPNVGPQVTLYAPSVYFLPYPQVNKIVLFELEHSPCNNLDGESCFIQFVDKHVINGPIPLHNTK
ncbi:Beta-galactosidase-1-like protein [Blomia tropicalis]|nr:Beta-galactosidase-1-like protein [Blomia tropicalis]